MGMKKGVIVNEIGYYNPDELEYNCSWDWLMPVIEKMEKIRGLHIIITSANLCEIFHFGKLLCRTTDENKITSVYSAVFICLIRFPKIFQATPPTTK